MDKLKSKLEDRADKQNKFDALVEAAKSKPLTEAEETQLSTLNDELEALETEIAKLEKIEARKKKSAAEKAAAAYGIQQDDASEQREMARFSYRKAFADISNRNFKSVQGFEKEMYDEAHKELIAAGVPEGEIKSNILIPAKMVKYGAEKSLLDVATEGVDLVRTEYRPMIPSLRIEPVVDRLGITKYTGLKGNIKIPRSTNEATFAWETENSSADEFTLTFDAIDLSPKRLAGYTDVSGQMLVQSNEITEGYLRSKIEYGIAAAIDTALLAGATGGNNPVGILNFTGVNVVSLGSSGGNMTYGTLVAMIAAVEADNGRDGNSGFVMNSNGFASLALTPYQTNGVEGNFILVPGRTDLWGRKFIVTNRMPSDLTEGGGSALSAMIYSSNWKSAILATWGGVGILFDPYTQALVNKIRIVVNTYADVDIEHPEEFAVIKDWDTTLPALT
jgi:HK97 family phage major capsid protein